MKKISSLGIMASGFLVLQLILPSTVLAQTTGGFAVGDRVKVAASVNVRSAPSLSATILGVQSANILGTIVGGPTVANNYTWWQIDYDTGPDGWSVESYLTDLGPPTPPGAPPAPAPPSLTPPPPIAAPVISGISPSSGAVGSQVTVTGSGFMTFGKVGLTFGAGVISAPPSQNGTSFIFTVPARISLACFIFGNVPSCTEPATTTLAGNYVINTTNLSGFKSNSVTFTVTPSSGSPPITISSLNPSSGGVGTSVTVSGSGFTPRNSISFGRGMVPSIVAADQGTLNFSIPADMFAPCRYLPAPCSTPSTPVGLGTYNVYITNSDGETSGGAPFTVTSLAATTPPAPPTSKYTYTWDTAQDVNGPHVIKVVAYSLGASASTSITVSVTGSPTLTAQSPAPINIGPPKQSTTPPPTITITAPQNGATVSGTVDIDAQVSSVNNVDNVVFYKDGVAVYATNPVQSPRFVIGDRVRVGTGSSLGLHVRSDPSVASQIIGTEQSDSLGTIVGGSVSADNYTWWQVSFDDGLFGWAVEDFLIDTKNINLTLPPTPPTPPPPPVVIFTNPRAGATVSGSVVVSVTVSSTSPVTSVTFYKDSATMASVTSAPYSFVWDTTKEFNGPHTLRAIAASGGVNGSAAIGVTVTGGIPPPVPPKCAPPYQTGIVGTVFSFTASAGNGTYSWSALGGSPSSGSGNSFSTSYATTGARSVTVLSGGLSAFCTVNIPVPPPPPPPPPAPPPAVTFVNPQNGAVVSGNVNVQVTVSSTNPVTSVTFYADATPMTTVRSAPYSFNWDTSRETNGPHSLRAIAVTTGRVGSASIGVTVGGGIGPPPPPPPPPPKFAAGDRVMVFSTKGVGLNARTIPSITTSTIIATEPDATLGTVLGGPTKAYGSTWWQVKYDTGVTGWSVEDFLMKPKFVIGSKVTVSGSPNAAGINVRTTPSTSGAIVKVEPEGAQGTVSGGPSGANNYIWWQVKWNDGASGWSVDDYLQ